MTKHTESRRFKYERYGSAWIIVDSKTGIELFCDCLPLTEEEARNCARSANVAAKIVVNDTWDKILALR